MKEYLEDQNTKLVKIVGKGPSITSYINKRSNYEILVCINSSIIYCYDVDFLFMNDKNNLDKISKEHFYKTKNIVIPTFPHMENELPDINFSFVEFIKRLPSDLKCNFYIYELYSAPIKMSNIKHYGNIFSTAETAFAFFIDYGFKNFETNGITNTIGYNSFVNKEQLSSNHSLSWLEKNIKCINKRIIDSGSKIIYR